jgi:hypothetical protein
LIAIVLALVDGSVVNVSLPAHAFILIPGRPAAPKELP